MVRTYQVSYKDVDTTVPGLINKYNPILVINVGLSSYCQLMTLEPSAVCTGYNEIDNDGKTPKGEKVLSVQVLAKLNLCKNQFRLFYYLKISSKKKLKICTYVKIC